MIKNKKWMGISVATSMTSLALVPVLFLSSAPAVFAGPRPNDSEEVTKLLSDVKSEAVQLKDDTEDMKSFTMSKLTWQSHAAKIEQIK